MSARSAGDELRPAANVSHVLEPTPTNNVPSKLSPSSSSAWAPRPSIQPPRASSVRGACANAGAAASAQAAKDPRKYR